MSSCAERRWYTWRTRKTRDKKVLKNFSSFYIL